VVLFVTTATMVVTTVLVTFFFATAFAAVLLFFLFAFVMLASAPTPVMMVVRLATLFMLRMFTFAAFAIFFDDFGYPAKRFGCLGHSPS